MRVKAGGPKPSGTTASAPGAWLSRCRGRRRARDARWQRRPGKDSRTPKTRLVYLRAMASAAPDCNCVSFLAVDHDPVEHRPTRGQLLLAIWKAVGGEDVRDHVGVPRG